MNITVYTITYNEEIVLPFFIKHYRNRFPNCKIVIFDNESTDNTQKIALENGCEIFIYDTNNQIMDDAYLSIKNRCWKDSNADWVIIVDCDEFLDIQKKDLTEKYNIIKSEGWDMIGDTLDINKINSGVRSPGYDKICAFKPQDFEDINYEPGAHTAFPISKNNKPIIFNTKVIKLFHYKWIQLDYVIERFKLFNERLSDINRKYSWGIQYTYSIEKITEFYNTAFKDKTQIR